MSSTGTFDDVWTRAGPTVPNVPHDQTIRDGLPPASAGPPLPPLSVDVGATPSAEADLQMISELGSGGMGTVWLAHQRSLDRDVAIKQTLESAPARADDALVREARFMGCLEHPNIVPVHVLGVGSDGRPLLVMKRIEGIEWRTLIIEPLHPWWDRWASDHLVRHLEILIAVCNAVEFAHSRGIIHRDLKPENVMLGEFGEIYLGDWGVATRADEPRRGIVGTPAYMAPEMVDTNCPIGPWTDVYLLGACLHEVLTGRPRHRGREMQRVLRSAFESEPYAYLPGVPAELAAICNRACARDPDDRFRSAADLQRALLAFLQHRGAQRVANTAAARLEHLQGMIERHADREAVEEAIAQCRFGFQEALDLQPDNKLAREGLERLLTRIVPYKLAGGDVDGAAAIIDQLDAHGIDASTYRADVAAARAAADRLRDIAADQDISVGARIRALGILAAIGLFSALSFYVLETTNWRIDAYDYTTSTQVTLFAAGATIAGILAGRQYTLAGSVNRSISLLAVAMPVALLLNRLVCWRFSVPLPAMLASDLVLLALGAATAWMIRPQLALASLPAVGGLVLMTVLPQAALPIFGAAGMGVIAAFGVLAWRAAHDREA